MLIVQVTVPGDRSANDSDVSSKAGSAEPCSVVVPAGEQLMFAAVAGPLAPVAWLENVTVTVLSGVFTNAASAVAVVPLVAHVPLVGAMPVFGLGATTA